MISIDYKDWFINQKRIPDAESKEAEKFFEFHKRLATEGFMMNGIFINPFLYWHLNFWHTEIDVIDERGVIHQKYINPYFRDNEWIISNAIHKANEERKGLIIAGIRRLSKSVTEASYIAWGATFDENSQNVISGLNSPDIKLITDKLDKGLNHLPWYYRWDRIEDNWKQQVTLGIRGKSGERYPFSYILIRNLDDGNNEEAIAGTKPRKLVIDEGAKGPYLKALMAAIPGFTTTYGWGCSPIVCFTGGDAKRFGDAKQMMFDCDAFNFLEFENKNNPLKKHGLFINHVYRLEAKEESTLGAYLGKPELSHVRMQVSNAELAEKITNDNLERAKKSGDRATYLKEKMYYPKTVDDIFLNEDTNIYDIEMARRQKMRLLSLEKTGTPVILYLDEQGRIMHEFTDKMPITSFPSKPTDDKDAPVMIYEFPVESPPYGLYVAGVDPYRQGKAAYSTSLGVIYIYKRMHNIMGEKYQDMFVASYAARPDKKEKWEEQARLLIKYYNARVLCENDEISFIEYMKAKGDAYYLEKQPGWLKEIVPNTTVTREFGIHRSADKIRDYLNTCLKRYTEEVVYSEKDEEGKVLNEQVGMYRILDPMLLEEMIQFNEVDNFDRIVAASLAIAQAVNMDAIIGRVTVNDSVIIKSLYSREGKPSLFSERGGMFNRRRQRIFV